MRPIGVLALQGDFREHIATLSRIGISAIEVRKPEQLQEISGLIIPGGESTVIDKLSKIFGIREPLIELIESGLPVFGTCAGLIMLSRKIIDGIANQDSLGVLDVEVQRNAYGSQLDSFESKIQVKHIGSDIEAAFIRAPIVANVGHQVEVLAEFDGQVVAVRQGNLLGITFHPEVTSETRVHEFFVQMCRDAQYNQAK